MSKKNSKSSLVRKAWVNAGGGNSHGRRFLRRHPELRPTANLNKLAKATAKTEANRLAEGNVIVAKAENGRIAEAQQLIGILDRMAVNASSAKPEQLPPPPAMIKVRKPVTRVTVSDFTPAIYDTPPNVVVIRSAPESAEPPKEYVPSHCNCSGGYKAAQSNNIPPKKLGFIGRILEYAVSFRKGGRNYRGH